MSKRVGLRTMGSIGAKVLAIAPPPSTVGTTTWGMATAYPLQRKTFYANGRYWVFYTDGTNLVYRTSTDGITWSAATS